jgi:hypothetical protein
VSTRIKLACVVAAILLESSSHSQPPPVPATGDAGPRPSAIRVDPVDLPHGREYFVSPSGTPDGNGSRAHPWDIETALRQPDAVKPGDTIWIRGGSYGSGAANAILRSRLTGTPRDPILVRAWPGERAIIDAWLQVGCCEGDPQPAQGAFVWFWGLEFAGFNPDRRSGRSGPPDYTAMANHAAADTWAPGSRFINCIVHDTAGGLSLWQENSGGEAYGNLIYYVGGQGSDRGHGHGFYAQNATGVKHLADNIVFSNFGSGMQCYGSKKARVRNFLVEGNILFDNGSIAAAGSSSDNILFAGGEGGAQEIRIVDNCSYFRPGVEGYNEFGYTWSEGNGAAVVRNNYFVGGLDPVDIWRWTSFEFTNNLIASAKHPLINLVPASSDTDYRFDRNVYYGSDRFTVDRAGKGWPEWRTAGRDANSRHGGERPAGATIVVRPNRYEAGRANIAIYNWDRSSTVAADVSPVLHPGASYELRDAENYFGVPVLKGVYRGERLAVPMHGLTAAPPNGSVPRPPVHTAPDFGAFVLLTAPQP